MKPDNLMLFWSYIKKNHPLWTKITFGSKRLFLRCRHFWRMPIWRIPLFNAFWRNVIVQRAPMTPIFNRWYMDMIWLIPRFQKISSSLLPRKICIRFNKDVTPLEFSTTFIHTTWHQHSNWEMLVKQYGLLLLQNTPSWLLRRLQEEVRRDRCNEKRI